MKVTIDITDSMYDQLKAWLKLKNLPKLEILEYIEKNPIKVLGSDLRDLYAYRFESLYYPEATEMPSTIEDLIVEFCSVYMSMLCDADCDDDDDDCEE